MPPFSPLNYPYGFAFLVRSLHPPRNNPTRTGSHTQDVFLVEPLPVDAIPLHRLDQALLENLGADGRVDSRTLDHGFNLPVDYWKIREGLGQAAPIEPSHPRTLATCHIPSTEPEGHAGTFCPPPAETEIATGRDKSRPRSSLHRQRPGQP